MKIVGVFFSILGHMTSVIQFNVQSVFKGSWNLKLLRQFYHHRLSHYIIVH